MKNENKNTNINEFNSIELMRAIYKEIIETKEAVNKKNAEKIDELGNKVTKIDEEIKKIADLSSSVEEMKKDIKEIKGTLNKHTEKLEEHDKRFDNLEKKTDNLEKKLDNLDKIEKLHFEYTRNKFGRLDKKIDTNFSCLENKIENEAEERKNDISRIEGNNDFDRIVLSDFGSRISILEEESEKYNIN